MDLLGSPRRRQFVQARFSHVLVDEYQDLNGAQLALVEILSRPWRSLFVVGDDDQLIYGWRFAKLTNILDFHERMPPEPYSRTYTLTTNYRSSRVIVEKSRRLIDHNQRRVPKDVRPAAKAAPGEVRYARSNSWLERCEEVVNFLAEQRQVTRCWSDLAVLCRYKAQQPLVALVLDRAGIPRSSLLTYRLFSDQNVRLLRSYIDLARKPKTLDGDSFRLLLNRPNRYLANELVERYAQAPCPWDDILYYARQDEAPRGLIDLVHRVSSLREKYRRRRPSSAELLDDVILSFGLEAYWKDEASPRPRRPDEGNPLVLVDLIRFHASEISAASDFLDFWDERVQREERHFGMEDDTLGREESPEEDHVVIGTLHSSKGREYEAVVLFDYDLDLSELAAHEVEEERRVFYVGLTRARDSALITIDGSRESLQPFIRETMAQGEPGELRDIQFRLRDLRSHEEVLVIERTKVQAAMEAVFSGEEIQRLEQQLRALHERLSNEEQALAELEDWLSKGGVRGIWRRARGKRHDVLEKAASAQAAAEQTRRAADERERRMLLVRGDPDLAAYPLREQATVLEKELVHLQKKARLLRGRIFELELLDPSGPAGDRKPAETRPT
jgi:superfamily I DNA/RNA helicase